MPENPGEAALRRFAGARVARLATVTARQAAHIVPVVFALRRTDDGHVVYTAVDGKPKSARRLQRLANIAANPRVSLLVDHYDEDWDTLWWIRADGIAAVHDDGDAAFFGRNFLRAKYPQYETVSLSGPVIEVLVERWSSWG